MTKEFVRIPEEKAVFPIGKPISTRGAVDHNGEPVHCPQQIVLLAQPYAEQSESTGKLQQLLTGDCPGIYGMTCEQRNPYHNCPFVDADVVGNKDGELIIQETTPRGDPVDPEVVTAKIHISRLSCAAVVQPTPQVGIS